MGKWEQVSRRSGHEGAGDTGETNEGGRRNQKAGKPAKGKKREVKPDGTQVEVEISK